ncbi:deubiquitinating protein VCPIP1-like [Mercenaria mercenaria]|uniref:deubiquitinating protein VCPIP1-like n=1 Tax=Mercenaria mercenaria TaxID=6596 RepID=UPI00234F5D1A|nr:deubiquitinating protein VCPIP1-like [Mercenaria mercenaria]XP_053384068.1 deubiquitinating protein VCPIP1-like [Mercenaria mercenaria]XP_053384069.1 deubiquitinating protein VCPIP1-like [Mercenaria mercenaria]
MASRTKRQKSSDARLMYGTCPDEGCQAKLYFPSYDKSIECTNCGQRHERATLKNVAEVTNPDVALHNLLKNILLGNVKPKKGADNVKVLGLSNYVCKLISPILTYYGIDKEIGKAKLLSEMGKGEVFDVSILGDRAFLIEEEHLDVIGYGKDRSGSLFYLADTLNDIKSFNENQVCLVPIHADGDGHCLVHAISRALVGRELFWHALRVNLKMHMTSSLDKYKLLFKDFVDKDEWDSIIEECDPYYIPPEGEAHGLRNIHIFGLANVLHRPIILLDSKSGMNSSGDYSGVFLPGLVSPDKCKGKDGTLNKPLCIAWSSSGRNHYIPLAAVKGKGAAMLPSYMVQKSWGMPKEEIPKYIEFDKMYRCSVGGDKCLTERYMRHLVGTMEEVFKEKNDVNPNLVADVHQYIYKSAGIVGVHTDEVIDRTKNSVKAKQLYRCLMCEALVEYVLSHEDFEKGGNLYKLAVSIHKKLDPTKMYSFPLQGAVCSYDEKKDCLVPDLERSHPKTCAFCSGEMLRQVCTDGTIVYKDGDRTTTPCVGGKCPCGFKHFWQGKEYDNLPDIFPISLQWGGKSVTEKIAWFQYESDPTLNSNVFEVAQSVVQKHFPGEFGSERLVQRVVDSILAQSAMLIRQEEGEKDKEEPMAEEPVDAWSADTASKIILTGQKKKTIHKEELMKSEKEKQVRKNIQTKAPQTQHRKTTALESQKQAFTRSKESPSKTRQKTCTETSTPAVASTSLMSQSAIVQPVAGEKKVRLQTSDGRQVMLTLVKDVTYAELQKLIFQSVKVPADHQKLRVGFPPKLLEAPPEGEEDKVVPLHHGDKIALEILPDLSYPVQETSHPHTGKVTSTWSSFEEDAQSQTAEKLLQALKGVQHGGDNIDTSIASLGILSAVQGKDLWTYVQGMPHLFSVGGLLYNQVKRDLGLVDGKHCQLPALPGKVFRYNGVEDRLELCLEPYGHYPVEPNIEQKVKAAGMEGSKEDAEVKFGASGAIHHGTERPAFLGQGHSLKSTMTFDERMPVDLACANHHPAARGIHDLCSPPGLRKHSDSISEEPDEMQTDDSGKEISSDVAYQRLGPGYSVIDQTASNSENSNLEMFRALAEHIEKTLSSEDMDKDETVAVPDKADKKTSGEAVTEMETTVEQASAESKETLTKDNLDCEEMEAEGVPKDTVVVIEEKENVDVIEDMHGDQNILESDNIEGAQITENKSCDKFSDVKQSGDGEEAHLHAGKEMDIEGNGGKKDIIKCEVDVGSKDDITCKDELASKVEKCGEMEGVTEEKIDHPEQKVEDMLVDIERTDNKSKGDEVEMGDREKSEDSMT